MEQDSISISVHPCNTPSPNTIKQKPSPSSSSSSPPSILTKINAESFTICVSFATQLLLLNALVDDRNEPHVKSLIPSRILHSHILSSSSLLMLWLSLSTLILISSLYTLKCIFHFCLVKAECSHAVAANFLFAPSISWLLLLHALPPAAFPRAHGALFWVCVAPVAVLDVKIYGQWFTTERRFLSLVANPTSHLPMMGNFVGAWAAAGVGWRETAVCIFAVGLVHYLVVFTTLYQRLAGAARFRAALRPVFFLFCATPSAASLAWSAISGGFGTPCKLLFFLSLFLLVSLICRPRFFKKSMKRFSMAWWVYSFPLSFVALASTQYAGQVKGFEAALLMLLLSALSVCVFLAMLILTALNSDRLLLQHHPSLTLSSNH